MIHSTPLFEYRWREQPWRSLAGTLARTLVPPLVWRNVPAGSEPRIGPLLVLLAVAGIGTLMIDVPFTYVWFYQVNRMVVASPVPAFVFRLGVLTLAGLLIWGSLLLFQTSSARRGLSWRHALRAVVLAWVAMVIWRSLLETPAIYFGVGVLWGNLRFLYRLVSWDTVFWIYRLVELIPLAILFWSICLGLKRHLGLFEAICMIGISLVLTLLTLTVSVASASVHIFESFDNPLTTALEEHWPAIFELTAGIGLRILTG